MFRITISWDQVPPNVGQQAAVDIAKSFSRNRPWQRNVTCTWDKSDNSLILQAENDYDKTGFALIDEFSDEISACVKDAGDGDIHVISVTNLPDSGGG